MVSAAAIGCDLSGSMMECGKRFIMRTVLRTISQYYLMLNPDADFRLFSWQDTIMKQDWSLGDDLPDAFMNCSGTSNVGRLVQAFPSNTDLPIMILSDGYWDDSESQFKTWAGSFSEGAIRIVLLGCDAKDPFAPYMYKAEDLLAALEGFGG